MTGPHVRTVPALYHGARRLTTTHAVWHATAGGTADSSLGWLNRPTARTDKKGVAGYTAMIDRDGTIIYHTPLTLIAFHAGASAWPQPSGPSLNHRSVGIAFANRQLPEGHARHERVTEAQIASARWLVEQLVPTYPALRQRAAHLRHRDVAPTRRSDPTPDTLDWEPFLDTILRGL